MNRSLAVRRLYWKEFRQLMPLVLMLAVIGLLLHLVIVLSQAQDRSDPQMMFFLGLPGLFAAGAGALLIGQEKDQRTLFWLSSLPIPKQDLIRIKFIAGLLGLVAVWGLSFLLLIMAKSIDGTIYDSRSYATWMYTDSGEWFWPVHSVFLLIVGFATAWYFRSTFVGLLVLVGVTFGVSFLIFMENHWILGEPESATPSEYLVFGNLFCISAVTLWLGWRAALQTLSPERSPQVNSKGISADHFFERSAMPFRSITSPSSALIWQFVNQNRAMLIGIVSLLGLAVITCLPWLDTVMRRNYENRGVNSDLATPGVVLAFVAICWLGVVTFQGDNLQNRIRFLADRGISPSKTWFSRLIIPMGITVLVVLLIGLLTMFVALDGLNALNSSKKMDVVSEMLLTASFLWIAYSFAQWISQMIRSPVIAAVISPIACCLPFAYFSFATETLESPIWVLAIVSFIPLIATYRMTQDWMDNRSGVRHWLSHLGWLGLGTILPAIFYLFVFLTYPSIPASDLRAFHAEASKTHAWYAQIAAVQLIDFKSIDEQRLQLAQQTLNNLMSEPGLLSPGGLMESAGGEAAMGESPDMMIGGMSGMGDEGSQLGMGQEMGASIDPLEGIATPEQIANRTWSDERDWQFASIERQLKSYPMMPISAGQVVEYLMSQATLVKMRMQDEGETEVSLERYQRSIKLIDQLVEGTRRNQTLVEQQNADTYEAWLFQQVQSAGSKKLLGEELYSDVIEHLANESGRNFYRYQSLYSDYQKGIQPFSFGDMKLGVFKIPAVGRGSRLAASRRVLTATWNLRQYLMAKDGATIQRTRALVAKDWNVEPAEFQRTVTPFTIHSGGRGISPGIFWHGEWEKKAVALWDEINVKK